MHDSGYFDLQVNGYAGVDFNGEGLTVPDAVRACSQLREDGVASILATVITDRIDSMCRKLTRICQVRSEDANVRQMIQGIHIEGPFLNSQPGYVGAHDPDAVRPADTDTIKRLLDASDGQARIVTLAPERDENQRVTRMLDRLGICVSAGHCNPTMDQLRAALDAGLRMFTHLGNGCPLNMHRHDNIIQRVLSVADRLWIGLIADGVHVPFAALGNYLRCAGPDRCFVVTDAISAAGMGPGTFPMGNRKVVVDDNLATWAEDRSHLIGSAGTMSRSDTNLREQLGLTDEQVNLLTVVNPRQAVGRATAES